jgi:hypothetical protein
MLPASLENGQLLTPLGIIAAGQWRWAGEGQHDDGESGAVQPLAGQPMEVMLRQEDLQLESQPQGEWQLVGREFLGSAWLGLLECRGQRLRLKLPLDQPCELGMNCRVTVRQQAVATLFGTGEVGCGGRGVPAMGDGASQDSAVVGV